MTKKDKRVDTAVKGLSHILDVVQKAREEVREPVSLDDFSKIMTDIQGQATTAFVALTVRPEHLDMTLDVIQKAGL